MAPPDDYGDDERDTSSPDEETPLIKHSASPINERNKSSNKGGGRSNDSTMPRSPSSPITSTLFWTVFIVTLGSSLQFGYGTGVMNNTESVIRAYFENELNQEYTLLQWSFTVSSYGIGGLIGALLGPKVFGRFCGRRTTLLINNCFLLSSSYMIVVAPVWWYQAVGRVLVGIVAGIATAVVPTYLSEISPVAIRGGIGTTHQLGITVGILLSQALSTPSLNLFGSESMWQWLFAVPLFCGLLQCVVLPLCPESPSYLYQHQGKEAARAAIVRFQSEEVADEYLAYIQEEDNEGNHTLTVIQLILDRSLRKQLIVGVMVQLMMQFSGIDAVFYYSSSVFRQADVADPELATTCLGIVNVFVTIFAIRYMDVAGRKTLLTYSLMGMCASFATLTASFLLKPVVPYMDQLSIIATTGIIVCFAFGPGCIAWFIIAEMFPLKGRDSAMAVGIFINWVANWLVALTFPILLKTCHGYTFLIFVATTAYFCFFAMEYVPETKGRTIREVTEVFRDIPLSTC